MASVPVCVCSNSWSAINGAFRNPLGGLCVVVDRHVSNYTMNSINLEYLLSHYIALSSSTVIILLTSTYSNSIWSSFSPQFHIRGEILIHPIDPFILWTASSSLLLYHFTLILLWTVSLPWQIRYFSLDIVHIHFSYDYIHHLWYSVGIAIFT